MYFDVTWDLFLIFFQLFLNYDYYYYYYYCPSVINIFIYFVNWHNLVTITL